MFWKKKCKHCSGEIRDKWNFCPACGGNLTGKSLNGLFGDMEKEFEKIDKSIGADLRFPRFRLKTPVNGGGVSITITSGTGMQPRVEVKTSGEYKKLEPEIKGKLGIHHHHAREAEKPTVVRMPKITQEPETKIQRTGNKQTITINLPDVKEDDVQIKQLEQSIEIRALAGEKAYFKLIPIPTNAYVDKKFKDGILKIEIVR